jgi:hypothetical protein
MNPSRFTLKLYRDNQARMDLIRLPIGETNRTRFVNDAIREKLDRDHPETNGEYDDFWGETANVQKP